MEDMEKRWGKKKMCIRDRLQCGRNSLQERNLPDGDDVFVQLVK